MEFGFVICDCRWTHASLLSISDGFWYGPTRLQEDSCFNLFDKCFLILRRALRHECTVGGDQDEAKDTTVNQIPEVLKKGRKEEGKTMNRRRA